MTLKNSSRLRKPLRLKIGEIKEWHEPGKLLLDFDERRPAPAELLARLKLCGIALKTIRFERSTNRGWHVIMWTEKRLSKLQTVAVQAILGSDPRREAINYQRATSGVCNGFWQKRFNILFAAKESVTLGQHNRNRGESRKKEQHGKTPRTNKRTNEAGKNQ